LNDYFSKFDDHIKIRVRLTPKAHKDIIDGVETSADGKPYLKARVRAVPENGKANKSLEKLIAKHFDVPKTSVQVTSGTTSRFKTLSVFGASREIMNKLLKE
jgi:uncharacterized protein (TIGR00251 family)